MHSTLNFDMATHCINARIICQGVLLLQKPFTRDAFARKIRQLLDTGRK